MITIFYASTKLVQENEEYFLPYVNEERLEKINRCQPMDRYRMITADMVLRLGLEQLGLKAQEQKFSYNQHGKRELLHELFHINISHANELAVVVIATKPVGIDIEIPGIRFEDLRRKGKIDKIVKKIATEQEQLAWEQLLEEEQADFFGRLWTRKESFVKMIGKGLSYGLAEVDTFLDKDYFDFSIGEYQGSVCMEAALDENVQIIELEEAMKCLMN